MNPLDRARKWFRLRRLQRVYEEVGADTARAMRDVWESPVLEQQYYGNKEAATPTFWMEAEEECPACPWRCPECNSAMTAALHDGWECLECGVVY